MILVELIFILKSRGFIIFMRKMLWLLSSSCFYLRIQNLPRNLFEISEFHNVSAQKNSHRISRVSRLYGMEQEVAESSEYAFNEKFSFQVLFKFPKKNFSSHP